MLIMLLVLQMRTSLPQSQEWKAFQTLQDADLCSAKNSKLIIATKNKTKSTFLIHPAALSNQVRIDKLILPLKNALKMPMLTLTIT